jgi:flagellar motor switch protein FliN
MAQGAEKSVQQGAGAGSDSPELAAEIALAEASTPQADSGSPLRDPVIARIPIEADVAVPIRNFRVRNLLTLQQGYVVESLWLQGEDLPIAAPGAQLAWSEFEVIDQKLAVRITRLV